MKEILQWYSIYGKRDHASKLIRKNEKCIPQFKVPYKKWQCEEIVPHQVRGFDLIGKTVEYMNINTDKIEIGEIINCTAVPRYYSKIDKTQHYYRYDIRFGDKEIKNVKYDKHLYRMWNRKSIIHLNITNEMIALINSYNLNKEQMIKNGNLSFKVC